MMHRTVGSNRFLKGLAIAIALVSSSVAPSFGEETPNPFDSQAVKGPDPRKDLRAEAALPGVDPDVARNVVNPNMTLLADPARPQVGNAVAIPASNEQVLIGSLKTELEATKAEVAKTQEIVGEVMKEYKQLVESRELPPLKDAEIKFFTLKYAKASQADQIIGMLLGLENVRTAIDDRTNSLIVVGSEDSLSIIEALLLRLDQEVQVKSSRETNAAASETNLQRTLALRVLWLTNDKTGQGVPTEQLPPAVINSLSKLGLETPQLVAQTVISISAEENARESAFSTQVPAVMFNQPLKMVLSGDLSAMADNRSHVSMNLTIEGGGEVCGVKGSFTAPIGHFMLLGMANSVILDSDSEEAIRLKAQQQARRHAEEEGGRGRGEMGMGRGGEMGMGPGGFGEGAPAPAPAKFNTSRFAFVVQVIEGESFAAEEGE